MPLANEADPVFRKYFLHLEGILLRFEINFISLLGMLCSLYLFFSRLIERFVPFLACSGGMKGSKDDAWSDLLLELRLKGSQQRPPGWPRGQLLLQRRLVLVLGWISAPPSGLSEREI